GGIEFFWKADSVELSNKPARIVSGYFPRNDSGRYIVSRYRRRLTDASDRMVQRWPFFLDALFLNLTKLNIGDFKLLDDMLPRFGHRHRAEVLGGDQGGEDLATLLQSQALGTHKRTPISDHYGQISWAAQGRPTTAQNGLTGVRSRTSAYSLAGVGEPTDALATLHAMASG